MSPSPNHLDVSRASRRSEPKGTRSRVLGDAVLEPGSRRWLSLTALAKTLRLIARYVLQIVVQDCRHSSTRSPRPPGDLRVSNLLLVHNLFQPLEQRILHLPLLRRDSGESQHLSQLLWSLGMKDDRPRNSTVSNLRRNEVRVAGRRSPALCLASFATPHTRTPSPPHKPPTDGIE